MEGSIGMQKKLNHVALRIHAGAADASSVLDSFNLWTPTETCTVTYAV